MISTPETRALAQTVFDKINEDPACHNQRSWGHKTECGTTMCVAGHTVNIAKPEIVKWFGNVMSTKDGLPDIGSVAANLLGLNDVEARVLFYSEEEEALQLLKKVVVGENF